MKKPKIKDAALSGARAFGDAIIYSRMGSRFPRFAHYSRRYTPLILVAFLAWSYVPGRAWWISVGSVVVTYTGLYALLSGISHTARLCEYCVKEFPLNGSELAAARRKRLWVFHFHWKRWLLVPPVIELLIAFAGPHFGLRGYLNVMSWTPFALAYAWGMYRYILTHDRLSAWCPWCRHNRPPQDVVEPDPDPAEGKPVPA